jgi:hypothetical protein
MNGSAGLHPLKKTRQEVVVLLSALIKCTRACADRAAGQAVLIGRAIIIDSVKKSGYSVIK